MIEKITEKYGEKLGKYYNYSNILVRIFVLFLITAMLLFILSMIVGFLGPFSTIIGITELLFIRNLLVLILGFIVLVLFTLSYLLALIYCIIMAFLAYKLEEEKWTAVFILGGVLCLVISFICPFAILLLIVLDIFYKNQLKEKL